MNGARVQSFFNRHHRLILVLGGIASAAAVGALLGVGLSADYRLEAFVATSDTSYGRFRAFMEEFTSNEFALVAVCGEGAYGPRTEAVIREIAGELRRLPSVERCSSLADVPEWLRAVMGDRLLVHPLIAGNLLSDDRRTAALLCQMSGEHAGGAERRETVAAMKRVVAAARLAHPAFEIILTGPYVTLIDMYAYVDRDLLVFSLLAFALTLGTTWAVFRRWPPMLFGGAVAASAVLCTLGLTIALGVVTSLITQMIVILVAVLAVANCVHLAVAAEETCAALPGADRQRQIAETLRRMTAPCTAVMLTTAVGFGSVCISQIAPVRRFGGLMVFGLIVALIHALAGAPLLHGGRTVAPRVRLRLTAALRRTGGEAARHRWRWVIGFAVGAGVLALGVPRLRFESDFVKNFRPGSEVRRSYRFIEEHLSPLGSMELVIRRRDGGSMATADAVRMAHALGEEVVVELPMVKKALTVADAMSLLAPGLPATDAEVGWRLVPLRAWSGGAALLRNFLNDRGDAQRVNFRCIEGFDVSAKLAAGRRIADLAAERFGPDYTVEVTGLYHFYAGLVADLLRDQYRALGITVAAIAGVLWLMLRCARLTLIALIVNLLPVVVCLGAMGWARVPVNMTTAMMLSVTLGIAVDDTLHYIWRLRGELAAGAALPEAIVRTHGGVGKACVFTTVVIAGGFSILTLSQFLPTAYFGGLVGFTMLSALAADLLLLPALIVLLGPHGERPGGGNGAARSDINRRGRGGWWPGARGCESSA